MHKQVHGKDCPPGRDFHAAVLRKDTKGPGTVCCTRVVPAHACFQRFSFRWSQEQEQSFGNWQCYFERNGSCLQAGPLAMARLEPTAHLLKIWLSPHAATAADFIFWNRTCTKYQMGLLNILLDSSMAPNSDLGPAESQRLDAGD